MSRILITSGPVYAHLDDNKILSNMARGAWAARFADFMQSNGHDVKRLHNMEWRDYERAVVEEVCTSDAAVMAAAVINYFPKFPFKGKMPTDMQGCTVELVRTPYIIDRVRRVNPTCKLIGCKLTSGEKPRETIAKAQKLIDRSKAHAVIANDKSNLRLKMLCFPDGAVLKFKDAFDEMYDELKRMIEDSHFRTISGSANHDADASQFMDKLIGRYAGLFLKPWADGKRMFGSFAVRRSDGMMMTTPRFKNEKLSAEGCPTVRIHDRSVISSWSKATMNAPLLWEMLRQHPQAAGVVHLHEFLGKVPTFRYAPPGTLRDSDRGPLPSKFNIDNHGFVACVNSDGDIL